MEMTQTDTALQKSVSRRTWRQLNRGPRWQWQPGERIRGFPLRHGTEKPICLHRTDSLLSFKWIFSLNGGRCAASAPRGSQQLVFLRPWRKNKPGEGRTGEGACGQIGRRFPLESHGEPGCGSETLNPCGHANWIGIAHIAAGALVERPGPSEARHPTVPENQPESISQQVNEYCGRAAPAVESGRAAVS